MHPLIEIKNGLWQKQEEQSESKPTGVNLQPKQWAMFLHFSILAGFIVPFAGLILPIILWQIKKDEIPEIDVHGKIVVNWLISAIIYSAVCLLLTFLLIGIPLLFILAGLCIVIPVIGGIKANNGEVWNYPLTIQILK